MKLVFRLKPALIFTLIGFKFVQGQSWPNWLGPNHTGSIENLPFDLPKGTEQYRRLWTLDVGDGWSSPIVSNGMVVLHDRNKENERIRAIDLNSGDPLWDYSYLSSFRDDFGMSPGPRSTPAISNKIVVTHGPGGIVCGINFESGKLVWKRNLVKDYDSPKGFFGRCS